MHAPPVWLRAAVWSLAIGFALVGAALAITLGSVWPLLAYLGFAVPLVPLATPRTARLARTRAR